MWEGSRAGRLASGSAGARWPRLRRAFYLMGDEGYEGRPGLRLPQGLGLRGAAPRCTGPAPGLASLGRRLPTRALGLRCWYLVLVGAAGMLASRCGLPGLPFERCRGVAPRWRHISLRCSYRLPTASSPRELRGDGRSRAAPPALAGWAAHHPIMAAQHAASRLPVWRRRRLIG